MFHRGPGAWATGGGGGGGAVEWDRRWAAEGRPIIVSNDWDAPFGPPREKEQKNRKK